MTHETDSPVSGRVRLACLTEAAIASTDGLIATAGPAGRWQTASSQLTVPGVLAVEDGHGRVDVEVHVAVLWPPPMSLEQLGDELRGRVRRAAAAAGMDARLGAISVTVDDVLGEAQSAK